MMFVSWETTVGGCVWEETNSVHLVYVCLGGDWFTAVGFLQGPSILPDKKGFRSPRSGRSSTISTTGKQKLSCPMKMKLSLF